MNLEKSQLSEKSLCLPVDLMSFMLASLGTGVVWTIGAFIIYGDRFFSYNFNLSLVLIYVVSIVHLPVYLIKLKRKSVVTNKIIFLYPIFISVLVMVLMNLFLASELTNDYQAGHYIIKNGIITSQGWFNMLLRVFYAALFGGIFSFQLFKYRELFSRYHNSDTFKVLSIILFTLSCFYVLLFSCGIVFSQVNVF